VVLVFFCKNFLFIFLTKHCWRDIFYSTNGERKRRVNVARQKKTRQQQAAETRRKLLASARKLFANYGFSGTRVRAINREAGMADGLLYHYFPGGKREMLEVLIKESLEAQKAYFDSLIGEIEDMPLEKVLDEIFRFDENTDSRNRHYRFGADGVFDKNVAGSPKMGCGFS
jgi:AcrR family transcriptional regulator